MADEQTETTTQADTTSSTTTDETTATDTQAETTAAADTATTEAAADTTDADKADATNEGTVLGGKEGDDAETAEVVGAPEKYELAAEGIDLDPALVTEAEPVLRELNLTNEQANKLLPMAAKLTETAQAKTIEQLTALGAQQKADWLEIAKKDEAIGGPKWDETLGLAAKGMDELGFGKDHPFRKALNETGFGNHRDVLFTFRTLGELVSEDGFVRGDRSAKADERDLADRMYGTGKE